MLDSVVYPGCGEACAASRCAGPGRYQILWPKSLIENHMKCQVQCPIVQLPGERPGCHIGPQDVSECQAECQAECEGECQIVRKNTGYKATSNLRTNIRIVRLYKWQGWCHKEQQVECKIEMRDRMREMPDRMPDKMAFEMSDQMPE